MNRTSFGASLCVFLLSLICTGAVSAQSVIVPRPQPDAYVRGAGIVSAAANSIGPSQIQALFRIDIAKSGSSTYGIFQWNEIGVNSRRIAAVISRVIVSADFTGNTATIAADGWLNGKPAKIKIYALDDTSGDFLSVEAITADTTYKREGGVSKGQIIIRSRPETLSSAKGHGTIRINKATPLIGGTGPLGNIGQFFFSAVNTALGTSGSISYQEYNPVQLGPIFRPRIAIHVPKVKSLEVIGNAAVLSGDGMLNGKPVQVWLRAVDNRPDDYIPPPPGSEAPIRQPDWFSITANDPLVPSLLPIYQAEGYLENGGIIVVLDGSPPGTD